MKRIVQGRGRHIQPPDCIGRGRTELAREDTHSHGKCEMKPSASESTVHIVDMALPNDYGVARMNDLVVFVPGAIIGDTVTITIERSGKKFVYGEMVGLDIPSPLRVPPPCPHFGSCGGCMMQNVRYDKQLEIKERYLVENLRRIGRISVETTRIFPVTPSPDTYYYRNKLELSFGEKRGEVILGHRKRLSPLKAYTAEVASVSQCPVFSPSAKKIIPIFEDFARSEGFMAFNPLTKKGTLKHLIIRESKSTGEIMVILETRPVKLPNLDHLIGQMRTKLPAVTSFYHATNTKANDVVSFERLERLFGNPSLREKVADLDLMVFPGTFLQPNTKSASLLYDAIRRELPMKGEETVLGLYCGSGPIELALSRTAKQIIAVDSEISNIAAAKENCIINGITNCFFHRSRAEDLLKRVTIPKPDVLILDPPRTGLSNQGLSIVKNLDIKKIAYVSCNPATLARDLRELCAHGYALSGIIPFDFFPHTGHLETLVILKRR